jgi:hypothetical protein
MFLRGFFSVVRQIPGKNSQRMGTAQTLPNFVCSTYFLCCSMYFCVVLYIVSFVSLSVSFVCICVLHYCHRLAIQLQLNISLSYQYTSIAR